MVQNKKTIFPIVLTVVIILFLLTFIGIVIWSSTLKLDLVSDSYYKDGIEYQNQINRIKQANRNDMRVLWNLARSGELTLRFPVDSTHREISGNLQVFRPSDAGLDRLIPIRPDNSGLQQVDLRQLPKGNWKLKIFWMRNGVEYYQEDILIIN